MKRNALLIGSFVILAFVLIIAAILWLSGNNLFSHQVQAVVYYHGNVSGLYVGAPVTFRGVSVGQVEAIEIEVDGKTLDARIPVYMRLQPDAIRFGSDAPQPKLDLPSLVQRGLRARLVAQSFVTGQKSIELDFVPNTPPKLVGGPGKFEIPATSDRFDAIIDQVAELPLRDTVTDVRDAVTELRRTLVAVQKTLEGTQAIMNTASKELADTGRESRAMLQVASQAITDVQASSTATLASITRLSETSRSTVANLQPELQRTMTSAAEAADSARIAMDRVADLTAPGAPLRSDLDAAVRDLSQAARGLRNWSELLEEKPNAIIFGNRRE